MKHQLVPIALGALWLGACQMPLAFQDPVTARENQQWQTQGRFRSEAGPLQAAPTNATPGAGMAPNAPFQTNQPAPLLGWNGGVVDSPEDGAIQTVNGTPTRGLEPTIEGRNHIIELYQAVLDERDQLITEVTALQTALGSSQTQLEAARSGMAERDTRISALEEGSRSLTEENNTLAARLTTAQIRRLEAEKLLLETQIAWHRERKGASIATSSVSPVSQPKTGQE